MWICIQNECESEDYTQILWEGVQLGEPISGQIIWLAEPTIKATAHRFLVATNRKRVLDGKYSIILIIEVTFHSVVDKYGEYGN